MGIFGEYELKAGHINGKPYYSSTMEAGRYGIWQSSEAKFVIGLTSNLGRMDGLAINDNIAQKDCPYEPTFDWRYKDVSGQMREANHGLTVNCISYISG